MLRITMLAAAVTTLCTGSVLSQDHAISLNGIDAYGTASGVGNLVANSTWEAWIRIPVAPLGGGAILQRWGWYSHALGVDTLNGQFGVDMYSCWSNPCPQALSQPHSLHPGAWHHVALVYGPEAGPSCNAYLDGALVAWCGPQSCTPGNGWETVLGAFGYTGYSNFLDATVDEARISNVPRYSDPFVPQQRFVPDANTVGLWHFDEGSGNVAYDSSSYGRHFTLHGGYTWVDGQATPPADFVPFGIGCPGTAGTPTLGNWNGSLPRLGTTFTMRLDTLPNSPVGVPLGYLGYSNTTAFGIPLPFSMAIYGMPPACMQWVDPTDGFFYTLVNAGGRADWQVAIPNLPVLANSSVYVQAIVFDWVLPYPLPAVATNGGELRMGW